MLVVCCLLGMLAASSCLDSGGAEPGPVRALGAGAGRVRGAWMRTRAGRRFEAYRGIRYAEPPTGELRFQPPKDILQYSGEVDASAEGPACPLVAPPDYYVDEDCLRINVYTPAGNSSRPLPVIFFIHPGGFYSMTGRSDVAGPHYLLERDLVLVTINYRLAALGFLSTGDEWAPGNNGLKDQVAALRWVRRNIRAFGGDPDLVTAAGVSAGAISALLYMVSPMTEGLFHRVIAMSGSPAGKEPTPRHQRHLAEKQARLLGCPTHSSRAIVECLKTKPWRDLGNSYPDFFEIGYDPVGLWSPVVEPACGQERFLTHDPVTALRRGLPPHRAVPAILSRTEHEFAWFALNILKNESLLARMNAEWARLAPISFLLPEADAARKLPRLRAQYLSAAPLADDARSAAGLGQLYADSIMGFPIHRMAELLAAHSPQPVYYYELAYVGNHSHWEDPATHKPVGAMHHDDMIYLLTLPYRFPAIERGSRDDRLVQQMTAFWYNMARYGDPNPRADTPELRGVRWPPLAPCPAPAPAPARYLLVGSSLATREYEHARYSLWEQLYPLEPWPTASDACPAAA